jgi:hypothetical protein
VHSKESAQNAEHGNIHTGNRHIERKFIDRTQKHAKDFYANVTKPRGERTVQHTAILFACRTQQDRTFTTLQYN